MAMNSNGTEMQRPVATGSTGNVPRRNPLNGTRSQAFWLKVMSGKWISPALDWLIILVIALFVLGAVAKIGFNVDVRSGLPGFGNKTVGRMLSKPVQSQLQGIGEVFDGQTAPDQRIVPPNQPEVIEIKPAEKQQDKQ